MDNGIAATPKREEHIDALRGLAAISVLVQHILVASSHMLIPGALGAFVGYQAVSGLDLGRFGVVLFFLISGYVIPFSLVPKYGVRGFVVTRFFRLYPAFWASLALTVLLMPLLSGAHFSVLQVLANISMVPAILKQHPVEGVYWTLTIEVLFYVICAALFIFGQLKQPVTVFGLAVALVIISLGPIVAHELTGRRLPIVFESDHLSFLLTGALLRMAFLEGERVAAWLSCVMVAIQVATVPVLAGLFFKVPGDFDPSDAVGTVSAYYVALALFIVVVWRAPKAPRALIWLGGISYSLYLFHWLCCAALIHFMDIKNQTESLVFWACAIVLSLGVATIFEFGLERPVNRFGKILRGKLSVG